MLLMKIHSPKHGDTNASQNLVNIGLANGQIDLHNGLFNSKALSQEILTCINPAESCLSLEIQTQCW